MALKRRRGANRWLVITQIIFLTLALVMLLFFRDLIATGASSVVGAFGDDDIRVQAPTDPSAKTPYGDIEIEVTIKPDAGSAEASE